MTNKSCKNKKSKLGGKTRKQKIYNMKGCYKRHLLSKRNYKRNSSRKCNYKYMCDHKHICNSRCHTKQNGGCSQSGGKMFGLMPGQPIGEMPGPFIGAPIGSEVNTWPGVSEVPHNGNYYPANLYKVDPQTMMKLGGSIKKSKSKDKNKRNKILKGGLSLVPTVVTNIGRDFGFNFKSAYNALNGYKAPINPMPYNDQFPNSKNLII